MSIGIFELIALILVICLGILAYQGIRNLAKRSPVVAFFVLGSIFVVLLILVLSIPTLRYQAACRNLGNGSRCTEAFEYLIRTKGVQQACDLALQHGCQPLRAMIPHYVTETYDGHWFRLQGKERQRINADQALNILLRCLGDKDIKVAANAAFYINHCSSFITPQNIQTIIPYLRKDFRPATPFNQLWWIVERPELAAAVPDEEIATGLVGRYADDAYQVFEAKYCHTVDGNIVLRPSANIGLLLVALTSPTMGVRSFACVRLHDAFMQAITATPGAKMPLLGNRAFEKQLGISGDLLQRKFQEFLQTADPKRLAGYYRRQVEEMMYYLTGTKA